VDVENRIKDLELELPRISLRVRNLEIGLEQMLEHLKDVSDATARHSEANAEFSAVVRKALNFLMDETIDRRK
jgi:spore cortex formation protein SpoVR/YcgB (stage V sporulation)